MRHLERACFGALLVGTLVAGAAPARAETMKECSVKFQAAKQAGTLNGADWKTFRAAQCSGKTASAAPASASSASASPASALPVAAADPAAPTNTAAATPAPASKRSASSADAPVATGNATFPGKIDAKYASLTPGRARMKTCDDQYKLNKANGGNGGMKWLQKGGGYYSACVKHLKAG